ncbi:MAG: Uma2 family endonuclease [Myxococcales bacterium]|nr:Uma2 family endonuclease [Myxococcales bacterium]
MSAVAVNIDGDRVRVPVSALDLGGFRGWVKSPDFPEAVRAAFVAGELFVEMSPESIESHNKVKAEVTSEVVRLAREESLGETYVDGALLTNEEAGVSTEPDLMFATWDTLRSGRLRLVEKVGTEGEFVEVLGSPDLVVEVVSDSSVQKDLVKLRAAYARAGIPEYWIIDARGAELAFEVLELVAGTYRASTNADGHAVSRVLARDVVLSRAKNAVGRWAYRLSLT